MAYTGDGAGYFFHLSPSFPNIFPGPLHRRGNWMSPARLRIGGSKICTVHCSAVVPNASVLRHLLLQKPMTLVEGCNVQNHLNKKSQLGKFLGKMLFIEIWTLWVAAEQIPMIWSANSTFYYKEDSWSTWSWCCILAASRLLLDTCQNSDAFICCCAELFCQNIKKHGGQSFVMIQMLMMRWLVRNDRGLTIWTIMHTPTMSYAPQGTCGPSIVQFWFKWNFSHLTMNCNVFYSRAIVVKNDRPGDDGTLRSV